MREVKMTRMCVAPIDTLQCLNFLWIQLALLFHAIAHSRVGIHLACSVVAYPRARALHPLFVAVSLDAG